MYCIRWSWRKQLGCNDRGVGHIEVWVVDAMVGLLYVLNAECCGECRWGFDFKSEILRRSSVLVHFLGAIVGMASRSCRGTQDSLEINMNPLTSKRANKLV